jgi:hypothetical protein
MSDISIHDWDIKINGDKGYFEWVGGTNEDDECCGGLWFDGNVLVDYDGVSSLPDVVETTLREAGYNLSMLDDVWDDSMDGDHASALASAGHGTDEDYGG